MDRRFVVSAVITLAAMPVMAGIVAIVMAWCLHQWNTPLWQLGTAGFSLIFVSSYVVWRIARKLASGRLAFSIRAMLISVAIIAVLLSTVGRWFLGTYRQHQAIRSVAVRGGGVLDVGDVHASDPRILFYRWIGYDPFERVKLLKISSDQALTSAIEHADQLEDVELLSFSGNFTAAGLRQAHEFNKLPSLRIGEFMESSIDGEALEHLAHWANHRELFFNGCPNVTDNSLRHLVDLPKLERLSLVEEGGGMVIGDAGLAHVGRMKNLKLLMLVGLPQVTDAGLTSLHKLPKLERLVLRRTAATEQGLAKLYKALPDCCVITDVFVPGTAGIQQIEVWKIGRPEKFMGAVSDPDRIAKIRKLLRTFDETGQQIDDWNRNNPLSATLRLEFVGATRTFYEVRLGKGAMQRSHLDRWGWVKWELPDEQEAELVELLE